MAIKSKPVGVDQARVEFGKALGEKLRGGISTKELNQLGELKQQLLERTGKGDAEKLEFALDAVFQGLTDVTLLVDGRLSDGENRRSFEPVRALLESALRDGKIDPAELGKMRKQVGRVHQDLLKAGKAEAAERIETFFSETVEALGQALSNSPLVPSEQQRGTYGWRNGKGNWQDKAVSTQAILRANRVKVTGEDPGALEGLEYLRSNQAAKDLAKRLPHHSLSLVDPQLVSGTSTIKVEYSSRWPADPGDLHRAVRHAVMDIIRERGLASKVWVDVAPTAATIKQNRESDDAWKPARDVAGALPKNAFEFRSKRAGSLQAEPTFDPVKAANLALVGYQLEVFRVAGDGTKSPRPIADFKQLPGSVEYHGDRVAKLFQKLTDELASGK